jgi:hypothetical protein
MSGFTTDLLTGIAALMAADDAVDATYRTTGSYTASETGVRFGDIPQKPDRVITLSGYPVTDDPALSDSVIGLQVRCRWGGSDRQPSDDLADAVFDLLHGLSGRTLSTGVRIVSCKRVSGSTLGQDANGRWSNVQNFYLAVHRPSVNRT